MDYAKMCPHRAWARKMGEAKDVIEKQCQKKGDSRKKGVFKDVIKGRNYRFGGRN